MGLIYKMSIEHTATVAVRLDVSFSRVTSCNKAVSKGSRKLYESCGNVRYEIVPGSRKVRPRLALI